MHRYLALLTLLTTPLPLIPSNSNLRGSQVAPDNSAYEIIPNTEHRPIINLFFQGLPLHLQEPAIALANKNISLKNFEEMQKTHFPKLEESDVLLIKACFKQCANYELYQKNKALYYMRSLYNCIFSE